MHAKSFQSCPTLVTLCTVTCQASLSMGFSRQEYHSGFCALLQGKFLTQWWSSMSVKSSALAGGFLTTSATWEAPKIGQRLWLVIFPKRTYRWPTNGKMFVTNHQGNVNQNHNEYYLTCVRMAIIKKWNINIVKDVENRESLCTVGRDVNWFSYYGQQYGSSSKVKNRTTMWCSNSSPRYVSREKRRIRKDTCTSMFIAALFTVAQI